MTYSFTLDGPPRTKKTSNRIIQILGKNGGPGFTKILPSKAHEEGFKQAMTQVPIIRVALINAGCILPIAGEVAICALFYRERASGDLTGFEQALADFPQEPVYRMKGEKNKVVRNGAGVIKDENDPTFAQFVERYMHTGAAMIETDFSAAFEYCWKTLDWEQKAQRVAALELHFDEYQNNPRFVTKPLAFLEREWQRPVKPPARSAAANRQDEINRQWDQRTK